MKIRLARESDEDFIKQIHKESKEFIGSFNLFYSWDDYLKRQTKYLFYVIEGKAFMRYGYSKMLKCYVIKEIAVKNEFKGTGCAKALFNHTKRPLYLTCNTDNKKANEFYSRMGMKFKGEKTSKNGKFKMNVWVM
jgi:RimJ/RimL family protein N-acetyltransferase